MLLWTTIIDGCRRLVDREDKDLRNIHVRRAGRRPDDFFSDITGSHCTETRLAYVQMTTKMHTWLKALIHLRCSVSVAPKTDNRELGFNHS